LHVEDFDALIVVGHGCFGVGEAVGVIDGVCFDTVDEGFVVFRTSVVGCGVCYLGELECLEHLCHLLCLKLYLLGVLLSLLFLKLQLLGVLLSLLLHLHLRELHLHLHGAHDVL
jgi:hypothetical protein